MIRFSMVLILIGRELRRLRKNPSALMLIGLLTAVALLLAVGQPAGQARGPVMVRDVWIATDQRTPWIDHLEQHLPGFPVVRIVDRDEIFTSENTIRIPRGHGLVEVLHRPGADRVPVVSIKGGYPGATDDGMAPFWNWFWPTVMEASYPGVEFEHGSGPLGGPQPRSLEQTSLADIVKPELMGTMLLLMVQFFSCCHLLVSFTSQDRERGTLTALVLSPARISEIMAARFVFHAALACCGSVLIVAILRPAALTSPVLWLTLGLSSLGLMSVGTCISTLTRTQAAAGLLALCYMLSGAIVFFLATKFSSFAVVKRLAFENYSFLVLHATLKNPDQTVLYGLDAMLVLVGLWLFLARQCFYHRGWR